jgi:amidophosphoribosyltransferase
VGSNPTLSAILESTTCRDSTLPTCNADELFRRYRLARFAEVDSAVLFRVAATSATRSGQIDTARYADRLRYCRGQIAAVLACRTDPGTVLMLKGNNPLELRWNPRAQVVLYASDDSYLNVALAGERGWRELRLSPMTLLALRSENLSQHSAIDFSFVGTASEDALDVSRLRQPWLEDL